MESSAIHNSNSYFSYKLIVFDCGQLFFFMEVPQLGIYCALTVNI